VKRLLVLLALSCTAAASAAANRAGRPMIIHRVAELGLEIWTEQDPQWETRLDKTTNSATWIAETPALTYPPARLSWTSTPQLKFTTTEIESAARGAIHQVAANYGIKSPDKVIITSQRHGDLEGYEAIFAAKSQKLPIEIRVFCGHRPGRPAVLMQAITLGNKLDHLGEQVRRSWSHVRYLP